MQKQNESAFLFGPYADTRATCLAASVTIGVGAASQASSRTCPFKAPSEIFIHAINRSVLKQEKGQNKKEGSSVEKR